ncbi:hypothetical protein ABPG74_002547 [Tetrahymena malaccensis]
MKSLIILALLQLVYSLNNFSEQYKKCTYIFCEQDQDCSDQAYPQLFCAIKQCPVISTTSINLSVWYLCFQQSLLSCNVSNKVANKAALFCFVNYDWKQDQININHFDDFLKIKPSLDKLQNQLQSISKQKQIKPCYQFPNQFFNCISQRCLADSFCISYNSKILLCALSQANNASDLDSWYKSFSVGFNSKTCKPYNISYNSDFCFMKYNWMIDCINFEKQ